jgi:hypothetical protein
MKIVMLLFLIGVINLSLKGQTIKQEWSSVLATNVVINGTMTGLGSIVHKPKSMSAGKAFLRGFTRGCLGGTIIFSGKYINSLVYSEKSLYYAWPSKLTVSLGASVVENAMLHKPIFSRYAIDIGPTFITFERNKKVKVQIMPISLLALAFVAPSKKIDWTTSLATGGFVFNTFQNQTEVNKTQAFNFKSGFIFDANDFKFKSNNYYEIVVHEFTHQLQFREYLAFNSIIKSNKTSFVRHFKVDFSLFDIVYVSMIGMTQYNKIYQQHWLEREAGLLSYNTSQ